MKITTKFRASGGLRFENIKRIMPLEMLPQTFGTFEKQTLVNSNDHYVVFVLLCFEMKYKVIGPFLEQWINVKPRSKGMIIDDNRW